MNFDQYLLIAGASALQLSLPIAFSAAISFSVGCITAMRVVGRRHLGRVIFLCTMFGFYGLVLGFLIGLSKESITRDAFSGIITILSGYFGYLLSKDLHPRLKAMVPAAVVCFLISLLTSITYFAKVRLLFGTD